MFTKHTIVSNDIDAKVDYAYIDLTWEEIALCWGGDPNSMTALIYIRNPKIVEDGYQLIWCPKYLSPRELCYGYGLPENRTTNLPPDLKAWRHEASEMWSYRMTGRVGANGGHGMNLECGM